jgi:tetratricopeptide (TPR) repeat protein
MNFGWQEGMSAEEGQGWFEEARRLALEAGIMRANAWAHAVYGRNLAVRGSADDYVARTREAVDLAKAANDRGVAAMLQAVLSQAIRFAGHLDEALEANIAATDVAGEISEGDRQRLHLDVDRWLTAMRGQILVLLGRFDEARPFLDRLLQSDIDPMTLHLVSAAYIDMAWATNDRVLADFHAERAAAIAAETGSPYVRVNALACRGVSHMVAGRFEAAVHDLDKALSFARQRKAGLEGEARILADLANAHRLNGDLASARRFAVEAIKVASARAARVPQCLARIVHAEVLLGAGDTEQVRLELPKIRALLEETGARLYEPLVDDLATRLEEAVASGRAACQASQR